MIVLNFVVSLIDLQYTKVFNTFQIENLVTTSLNLASKSDTIILSFLMDNYKWGKKHFEKDFSSYWKLIRKK